MLLVLAQLLAGSQYCENGINVENGLRRLCKCKPNLHFWTYIGLD